MNDYIGDKCENNMKKKVITIKSNKDWLMNHKAMFISTQEPFTSKFQIGKSFTRFKFVHVP